MVERWRWREVREVAKQVVLVVLVGEEASGEAVVEDLTEEGEEEEEEKEEEKEVMDGEVEVWTVMVHLPLRGRWRG